MQITGLDLIKAPLLWGGNFLANQSDSVFMLAMMLYAIVPLIPAVCLLITCCGKGHTSLVPGVGGGYRVGFFAFWILCGIAGGWAGYFGFEWGEMIADSD
ncbi:MAG: hypothetical protein R3F11_08980 [Verrucomicrobiales bacterium]